MTDRALLFCTLIFALAGCEQAPAPVADAPSAVAEVVEAVAPHTQTSASEQAGKLNTWFDEKYREQLQFSPLTMTFLGMKDKNDQIDEVSFEEAQRQADWYRQTVEEMTSTVDYAALNDQDKISFDLWKYQADQAQRGLEFFHSGLVFNQMSGPQSNFPTFLINFHRVDTKQDMQAYIARIRLTGQRMDELVALSREVGRRGVISPRFALEGVIKQAGAVISGAPFDQFEQGEGKDSDLWADVKQEIVILREADKLSEDDAKALTDQARDALLTSFAPSYQRVIAWAEEALEEAPEVASGVGGQPDGKAFYEFRMASQTTTDLTADQVHQTGLREVARIRGDMEKIMRQVDFAGDLQAFFAHVRDGEWNYYPDTDAGRQSYIDDATAAIDNIKAKLPAYFGLLPKADLVVKRVEPFREQDGAAQHYFPSTPDGSRPGIYYAHLSDMTAMPKNQLEVIAYHEGLPGHHMQLAIAQELESVPTFRTQARFSAYVEGWGLYSEILAKEMAGTYVDPYADFGRLTTEMWRAIRLVVDTGLHAKGWTEQQAIDYFVANSPEPLESVTSEVQRYIVMPGQALSYKIGMLKIQELRAKAERELGDRFDIRGFHDAVLGGGAIPLNMLERQVDVWIEANRRA